MTSSARSGPARPCPVCRKAAIETFRPFCSKRCADIDLGRWFNEDYSVPASSGDEEEKIAASLLDPREFME
ncbi:DNA gyrase inhibitor YacG [Swaminathania salitolerans]|uniref:DNA gyrase inhibitor YacG n=1 Tax=Swaminathania salitolerans TaxID=182838 RepID=A0A511BZB1_9PROT|nr:DNA gyrase inhibitor YacG [Swaminathania salitolerans]GBQ13112.1 hypothetical protein AA21291_1398 [Swaminathania salitolerans LMG 21291]GEL03338.1 DNA gyrase inhibitor YacG [Swaminathania salitolerans]